MRLSEAPEGAPGIVGGLLLSQDQIAQRVADMGAAISADYAGREVVLVTVLRGGLFFLSDLCRAVADPIRLDFMAISSYGAPGHAGGVRITKDLDENIEDRDVLIVEDIIDTGLTLNYLLGVLRARKPRSLAVAVLLDRDQRRIADVPISYRGFHMPDTFAVGYGLDLHGRYRNLPYIGAVREEVLHPSDRRDAMLRRLVYALSVFLAVVIVGTAGYVLIAGWPPLDALYMTVITMGGVGYREVHALDAVGQFWTMFVIVSGVGALGFAVITVTDFMVEGHFSGLMEGRRMNKRIEGLSGHHVVAGLGRVGGVVAEEFASRGFPFVVIDMDDEALGAARERGWAFIRGDATEEATLLEAGIDRASSLVTALDTDAANVFVTLTARGIAPELLIVARSTTPSAEAKLLRSGADRVITPTEIGGRRMASMVMRPKVVDFLDVVAGGHRTELKMEEIVLTEGDPYVGKTIADAHIRSQTGAYILVVHGADGSVNSNPDSGTVMKDGDRLLVLGSDDQLRMLAGRACADAAVCYPQMYRNPA